MPNFLVGVLYRPGAPRFYVVENVTDHRAARAHVREQVIGYDPAFRLKSQKFPSTKTNRCASRTWEARRIDKQEKTWQTLLAMRR